MGLLELYLLILILCSSIKYRLPAFRVCLVYIQYYHMNVLCLTFRKYYEEDDVIRCGGRGGKSDKDSYNDERVTARTVIPMTCSCGY